MTKQAPEIFQRPISDYPDAESAITQISLEYASKGWNAVVIAQDGMIHVIAVPEHGVEPKAYLLGLLQHGYLEDALPGLAAMFNMVDDPDIAYNYGLALSELGRVEESLAPLNKCLNLDPGYDNAAIAIGVALSKLKRFEEAAIVLKEAAKRQPDNPLVIQNLAGTLARSGKLREALPVYRQAAAMLPANPNIIMGLAQCLNDLGAHHKDEAISIYKDVALKFPGTQSAEAAKQILNRKANEDLHGAVDGGFRPDVVEYMLAAMKLFAAMPKEKVGPIVLEIAQLGEQGLAINTPTKRYTLSLLPGKFSGLQLLSYMHVGMRQFMPDADTGTGLDKEYLIAKGLAG